MSYIDQIANRLNSHWEEGGTCVGNESKCDRHVLRVAAVLHVFMSVMAMKLNRREPLAPPSENIADSTVKAAIKLVGYFKDQMKILEQVRVSFRRLMSGAPNDGFLPNALKRCFRLTGVLLKLCRLILGCAMKFLSVRFFKGNCSLPEFIRAFLSIS